MVKTRIAPSPTGHPHIGTMYQALFDYSYAKKNNGRFLVRIEDTDRTRFVEGAEEEIYAALDWFGIAEDESARKPANVGPYLQSQRLNLYKKYAEELVAKGHAYYCNCTPERLEKVRQEMQEQKKPPMYDGHCRELNLTPTAGEKYVVRLKVPKDETIIVNDLLRGEVVFDSNLVDDQVLLKSDGFATYHLAAIVDDHLMGITHAVRGEEWLPSAPKHILVFRFLGWEPPIYVHTPTIRNPDHSKFSKRQGHTGVAWYQEQGFLPEAILNYLALLGWSHPEGKDIFSLEEFTQLFDLKDIKVVGPVFDLAKLEWMNGEYIRELKVESLKSQVLEFEKKYRVQGLDEVLVGKTIPLIQERIKKLSDYYPLVEFFFKPPTQYEVDISDKKSWIEATISSLSKVPDWGVDAIGEAMLEVCEQLDAKRADYFMMMRVAITGKKVSPPLNDSMVILGQKESLSRLQNLV